MSFCNNCGKENLENGNFCSACGKQLNGSSQNESVINNKQPSIQHSESSSSLVETNPEVVFTAPANLLEGLNRSVGESILPMKKSFLMPINLTYRVNH